MSHQTVLIEFLQMLRHQDLHKMFQTDILQILHHQNVEVSMLSVIALILFTYLP